MKSTVFFRLFSIVVLIFSISCLSIQIARRSLDMGYFCIYTAYTYIFCVVALLKSFQKIGCSKVIVNKKYRISFKCKNTQITVHALVTANDIKKKLLKFETKEKFYEGKWNELKIQPLFLFRLKIFLFIFITIILLLFLYFYGYMNPSFHLCDNDPLREEVWGCRGWKCQCYDIGPAYFE